MLTGVVCLAVAASIAARDHDEQDQRGNPPAAGKGRVLLPLPDLTVTGEFKPKLPCDNGTLALAITAKIKNQGEGPAVLVSNWTKPWVTAYLSVSLPGFVKPSQTGAKTVTLIPGEQTVVAFNTILPPVPKGGYSLIFEVDPSNAIKENNEKNNTTEVSVHPKICG